MASCRTPPTQPRRVERPRSPPLAPSNIIKGRSVGKPARPRPTFCSLFLGRNFGPARKISWPARACTGPARGLHGACTGPKAPSTALVWPSAAPAVLRVLRLRGMSCAWEPLCVPAAHVGSSPAALHGGTASHHDMTSQADFRALWVQAPEGQLCVRDGS